MTELKRSLSSLSGKTLTNLSIHKEPEGARDRLRQREVGQVRRCGAAPTPLRLSPEDLTLGVRSGCVPKAFPPRPATSQIRFLTHPKFAVGKKQAHHCNGGEVWEI